MSVFSSRPAMRWLVPIAAAVAVIGGGAAVGTLAASADPSLPERSAAQLLVDLQTAKLDGLSGTVVQRAELGLPKLPALGGSAGLGMASLFSGSNTLRVWYNGPEQARVALVSTLGEIDLIHNGRDTWVWQSSEKRAVHYRQPAGSTGDHPLAEGSPAAALLGTPQQAADLALKAIEPTTTVTTGESARVAGRDAYELVLAPRDTASLVGQVRLAIDAKEHVPLRVEIFAKGVDDPAFEVAFTQISFDRPDAARFQFNPPPGTKVEEHSEKSAEKARAEARETTEQVRRTAERGTTVVGKGWTSVVVARMSDDASERQPDAKGSGGTSAEPDLEILGQFKKVEGAWGSGRLVTAKLFSALLTDDGRALVGLVSPEKLYEVAGSREAQLK